MIGTRGFVAFLSTVAFLLVGISLTVSGDLSQRSGQLSSVSGQQLAAVADSEVYELVVAEDAEEITYSTEERMQAARERVLAYRATRDQDRERFVVRDGEPESWEPPAVATTADETAAAGVQQCSSYSPFRGYWPSGVQLEEREGVRLVIDPALVPNIDSTTATGTIPHVATPDGVIAQLPVPRQPTGQSSCVGMDVVGIAMDGSLIRNDDYQAYGLFGADTIVGYALDGFPIYGRNEAALVDQCAGGIGAHGYGYILQSERSSILNCYSGRPTTF